MPRLRILLTVLTLGWIASLLVGPAQARDNEIPAGSKLVSLFSFPDRVTLTHPHAYRQLVITGTLDTGETLDLTRVVERLDKSDVVQVTPERLVSAAADGSGELRFRYEGHEIEIPLEVSGSADAYEADFKQDVTPVMSKLGCNAGTCHGGQDGKAGFKLSLRGYDHLYDYRSLVDDIAGRRFNRVAPDQSLMLLKASGSIPHVGGQLTKPGERRYEILRNWIAGGVKLDLETPAVTKIEIHPENPTIARANTNQQFAILAHYEDGAVRDVTADAFIESGDIEVAVADAYGVLTLMRRGEAPVLARYDGAYIATTVTVMGDRAEFKWEDRPQHNYIDELVDQKLKRVKVSASPLCTDEEFVRRLYLDLTGIPPTMAELREFLDDQRPSKEKRDALIDRLIGGGQYVEYWTNKWADLLQVNQKFLGESGVHAFRDWIKESVASNKPYDEMVYEILNSSGSNLKSPPSAYYKILRTPEDLMENTTQLFLAVRFNCNKCHDHPFERWTQSQYYHLSAFFTQVGRKEDQRFAGQKIGGSAVEGATPLAEVIYDTGSGEIKHVGTGEVSQPVFPYQEDLAPGGDTRREALARWITAPENQYFAKSYVNRLWGYLLGRGIIEPIDDIRAGNPPTNPELLEALTESFVQSGFDTQHILREICKSRVYQQSVASDRWNEDDEINFSHATARRLPAEVLFDSIHAVTGSQPKLPGVPQGFRATQLPDTSARNPFLDDFGRPSRESSCECERSTGVMLGPVMKLVNGPTISNAIADPNNDLTRLAAETPDDRELANQLFLRILNRLPSEEERQIVTAALNEPLTDRQEAEQALESYKAELLNGIDAWEASLSRVPEWKPLKPTATTSTAGAEFATDDEAKVTVTGELKLDTWKLEFPLAAGQLTGLRLEALTDPALAAGGPGRARNGNFVLNRLIVVVRDAAGNETDIPLANAQASFSQANWDVRGAIDGNTSSGWAIMPSFGVDHQAIFETAEPLTVEEGATLIVSIDHQYPDGTHQLGKFRLSQTDSPLPLRLESSVPEPLEKIVSVPVAERTEAQVTQLQDFYLADDAKLADLRKQVEQAKKLEENTRLIAVQDLAWALINSPSFLFNR